MTQRTPTLPTPAQPTVVAVLLSELEPVADRLEDALLALAALKAEMPPSLHAEVDRILAELDFACEETTAWHFNNPTT
jgi:hypothetical protein